MLNKKMMEKVKGIESTSLSSLYFTVTDELRGHIDTNEITNASFCIVYVAYLCKKNELKNKKELENYVKENYPEERQLYISDVLNRLNSEVDINAIASNNTEETLLAFLYRFSFSDENHSMLDAYNTPNGVCALSSKLLKIADADSVADLGCGIGNFIINTSEYASGATFYGAELNTRICEMAKIRSELFVKNCQIDQRDMFIVDKDLKFSKIFSNYPFGVKFSRYGEGEEFIEDLKKRIPGIKNATSSDWIYNMLLLDHLTDEGDAIGIMTNGSTWNNIDTAAREYFVENGFIKCMITLPTHIFSYTNISTTLVVLNHKQNKKIRMIDAREEFTPGRRINELSESNIDLILNSVESDTAISKEVSIEDIRENGYVLNPSRFLDAEIKIRDGKEFGSVIKHITRGAPLRASELDQMVSHEPTNIQYMMLANIQDGMICNNLPYLKELDAKYSKYCIKDKNLLISKNGAPFKVAVAEVDDKTVLANGNLYIIELDETLVDPYFLKSFFDSEDGITSLQRIAVGAVMPNIPVEALSRMIIPLPSLDEQHKIAEKYLTKEDEIKVLRLRLQQAQNEIRNIYNEGVD